jgi:hypothetical protein
MESEVGGVEENVLKQGTNIGDWAKSHRFLE